MGVPAIGTNYRDGKVPAAVRQRSYHASTEHVGSLYKPQMPLASRFEGYFEPLRITDRNGELAEPLWEDLGGEQGARSPLRLG